MKHNWKILMVGDESIKSSCESCGSDIIKLIKKQNLYSCETCGFQIMAENETRASEFSPLCIERCANCGRKFSDKLPLGTFHGSVDKPTKELLCVRCC